MGYVKNPPLFKAVACIISAFNCSWGLLVNIIFLPHSSMDFPLGPEVTLEDPQEPPSHMTTRMDRGAVRSLAARTMPSPPGISSVTIPRGHFSRFLSDDRMITTSPTSGAGDVPQHFLLLVCLSRSERIYSLVHLSPIASLHRSKYL